MTTRIFAGEQAMLSVVTIAPNAEGVMHHHPEEQWGVLLEGSAVRFQGGEEIAVKQRRFLAHARQRAAHHARRARTARACSISSPRHGRNTKRRGRGLGGRDLSLPGLTRPSTRSWPALWLRRGCRVKPGHDGV